jgi:hypothetical protein
MNTDEFEGHTPAPWIISEFKGRPAIHGGDETVVRSIARRLNPSHPADYKLIAAAPDLLAEVKRLTFLFEETNHHLDLMVECFGIEALVEMVGDEEE